MGALISLIFLGGKVGICMVVGRTSLAARVPGYLLIVLQLIIQDDAIGLIRLRPREGDAVHRPAHLVHDGHRRRGCKRKEASVKSMALQPPGREEADLGGSSGRASHPSFPVRSCRAKRLFAHS